MKTRIMYSFFAVLFLVAACRKSDSPELPGNLERAPIPQLSKDTTGDASISSQDIDGFMGKVVISQYFTTDHSYKTVDAVVIKNGDMSNVQVLQADITSLPTTVTFTAQQLSTLFNAPVTPGDNYTIGADIVLLSGQKIEAFPADGNPSYDPNVFTLPGIGAFSVSYAVFCPYDPALYDGNFVVVEDDWADYQPGDIVPVTMIDATHFSFEYATQDAQPIIVTVDPATNTTSIDHEYFGNYGAQFGNWFIQSVPSPNNYVIPCNGTFSVVSDISGDLFGDQGSFRIVMQKQ